jgi:RHS repeat-associated protein
MVGRLRFTTNLSGRHFVSFRIAVQGLKNFMRRIGLAVALMVATQAMARAGDAPPVMMVPGQFDVSAGGAATYSIPIAVPPGTAGTVPSLSLDYSSQSGDGIVGLGFSLSGLPSIGRCPRTLAQDSVHGSVNYDANDLFCLEGQRLVAITGTYGANGTEYRTEIEGFSKIISYGTAGTGPQWFKVWTKSGQIMEFGYTTDSRFLAQGITTARAWGVNKISDTKGNYLTLTYTNDTANGQAYPAHIDYTGNAGASLSPYNSVQFTYETRPDIVPLYHAGSLLKTTVRLINVKTYTSTTVFNSSTLVSDYRIAYNSDASSTKHSRVVSVTLCDATGNCLAPTTFTWQGTRDTVDISAPQATGAYIPFSVGTTSQGLTRFTSLTAWDGNCLGNDGLLGDWRGIGYSDIAVRELVEMEEQTSETWIYFCAGGFGKQTFGPHASLSVTSILELNGDGRADMIRGSTAYTSNGDGYFTSSGSYAGSYFDADGDGCTDRLSSTTIYLSTFCATGVSSYTIPSFSGYEITAGDFNGDGISDFLVVHNTNTGTLQLGTGRGFVQQSFSAPAGWAKFKIYPADFNGDGKTDIALIAPTSAGGIDYGYPTAHEIWITTGTGFVAAKNSGGTTVTIANINDENANISASVADWDNNGAPDLWIQDYSSGDSKYLITYTPELLASVSNGLGITTTFTYDRLNQNGTFYTKDTADTYPTVNIDGPFYVVSQVASSNGIGGNYVSTYAYSGAKSDQRGRGFLGFHTRTVTDLQTNIVQTTTYNQSWPFLGLVASETKKLASLTLNSTANTFAANDLTNGRRFVYLTKTVQASNDLDGTAMPTVTTCYGDWADPNCTAQYDSYGNLLKVTVVTPDGASSVTNNTYTNDTTNWFLGRLTQAGVTKHIPGGAPDITRTSSFAYDGATGLLTQEVIEPNNSALRLQTDYTYDAFGHRITTTVSGTGITTRSTSVGYDTKGQFATSVTNALGQSETWVYEPKFGLPTSQTGPNGLTTQWTYDGFGRPTLTIAPDGNRVRTGYYLCTSVPGGTVGCYGTSAIYVDPTPFAANGTTKNGAFAATYYDGLVRPVYTETESFTGTRIWTRTKYDGLGRVEHATRPFLSWTGLEACSSSVPCATFAYDALGRVTQGAAPDGTITKYVYQGLTGSVTADFGTSPHKNQTTTTVRNTQGLVASVTDSGGGVTTYAYDATGNLKTLTDPAGNVTAYTYDLRGRKLSAADPDMGTWSYAYNVLDELTSQTDAKSQTSSLAYDLLGRVTSRTETGLSSTWTYGTSAAAKNVGKLTLATTSAGYARALTYDSLGRPASTQLTIGGANFTYSSAYDTNGRLATVTYPSSFSAQYVYTALGYLSQLKDAAGGFVFWTANAMNAEGQLTQQTAGNGVVTNRAFDPLTGRLTGVTAGASNSIANLGFAYDALGNLASRSDNLTFGTEAFGYDNLNRLLTAQVSGQAVHSVSYNAIGNIITKTRLDNNTLANTYSYNAPGQARPHAVASVAGLVNGVLNPVYTYDLNGNLTSGAGRTVTWTAFNMVATIVQGATTMSYAYDSEHARITQTEVGASTTTTTYLNDPASGLSSEKVVAGSTTTWTDYLFAGGSRVGMRSMVVGGATSLRYFITDHLGSIAVITDGAGAVPADGRRAYDAWGRSRKTDGRDDPALDPDLGHGVPTRGFTGHEHITGGLVNMNARVYDPELGRFLSADSVVPSIFFSQALNRYSYVDNNPLSLTDPTGQVPEILIIGYTNPAAAVVSVVATVFSAIFGGLFGGHSVAIVRTAYIRPPPPPSPAAAVGGGQAGLPQMPFEGMECGGGSCTITMTTVGHSTVAANALPAACTLAHTGVPDIVITASRGLAAKLALAAGAPSAGVANEILNQAKQEPQPNRQDRYPYMGQNPAETVITGTRGAAGLAALASSELEPTIDTLPEPTLGDCLWSCFLDHFGLTKIASGVTIAGQPLLPYPRMPLSAGGEGTSIASVIFRSIIPKDWTFFGLRVFGTRSLGGILGRAVPWVGWGLLAYDAYEIGKCTKKCMSEGGSR